MKKQYQKIEMKLLYHEDIVRCSNPTENGELWTPWY